MAGFDQSTMQSKVDQLERELTDLRAEKTSLSTLANSTSSNLSMARAAHDKLISDMKTLETENARLKQDLAFYDRILPSKGEQGVSVRSFQIERDDAASDRRLRYRLLVSQDAKATKDFVGQVQFILTLLQDGRSTTVTIPAEGAAPDRAYALSFRMFQRLEGVLEIPAGSQARSAQVRVIENGSVRTQQSAAIGAG